MDRTVIIKQKIPPDERKWNEHFRFPGVLALGITLCVLGVLSMAMQFVGIALLTYFSTVGAGAWAGVVYLLAASMLIALYCHRLKRLVYGALAATIVSLVLAVALLFVFCVGAANDTMFENHESWGCAYSHIVTCDSYEENRSQMVAVQLVLMVIQLLVVIICCTVLGELGRPWIPCCRMLCGCCNQRETVVYTSHPFVKAGGMFPLDPGMRQQEASRVPIVIDIPKRGAVGSQNVVQHSPADIETVTNAQPPISYSIDIPAASGQPWGGPVNGTIAEIDVPVQQPVVGQTNIPIISGPDEVTDPEEGAVKTFPVMLIDGVPTVVDPERGNAPLDISPELQQTIVESFQHVPGVREAGAKPKLSGPNREARFQRRVTSIMDKLHQQYEGNEEFTVMDPVILDRRTQRP